MNPTFVLYAAKTQLSKEHFPVCIKGEVALWVRAEATDLGLQSALDNAQPRKGEIVLNAVDFDA